MLRRLFDQHDDHEVRRLFSSILDILLTLGLFDDRVADGVQRVGSGVQHEVAAPHH